MEHLLLGETARLIQRAGMVAQAQHLRLVDLQLPMPEVGVEVREVVELLEQVGQAEAAEVLRQEPLLAALLTQAGVEAEVEAGHLITAEAAAPALLFFVIPQEPYQQLAAR